MTLTVHHLQISQSERIVWLCEELGIPYELVIHKRSPVLAPPELKAISPLGAAPLLIDTSAPYSESQPLRLAESAAIVEYITQKYGGGRFMLLPTHKDYVDYLYWWHFSNGNLQPTMAQQITILLLNAAPDNPRKVFLDDRFRKMLKQMDEQLGKGPWLAGEEFTVADIMSVFSLTTMRKFYPVSLEGNDNLVAWLRRCGDRPAYQRARQKGDPDTPPALDAQAPPEFEAMALINAKQ